MTNPLTDADLDAIEAKFNSYMAGRAWAFPWQRHTPRLVAEVRRLREGFTCLRDAVQPVIDNASVGLISDIGITNFSTLQWAMTFADEALKEAGDA